MFSVIIPTMWSIPHYTFELVKNLVTCDLISEVIIIDNAPDKYKHKRLYTHHKIIRKVMSQNIFVNPAWNMGIELAGNKYAIICNDDIILKPDEILNFLLANVDKWDCVGLSPNAYEPGGTFKLNTIGGRPFGWGCFIVVKKEKWIAIPNDIKIFFGDDWLLKTYNKVRSLDIPFKVKTQMSTTSKPFASEYMHSDGVVFRKHIQEYTKEKTHEISNNIIEDPIPKVSSFINQNDDICVSIIMMSNLSNYENSRSAAVTKFNRAVQSFINQTYKNTELIIVSDGCELTNDAYARDFKRYQNIKLVKTSKSDSKWPGSRRQLGINVSTGQWIGYLDSDDVLHPEHISTLVSYIGPDVQLILNNAECKADQYFTKRSQMTRWGEKLVRVNGRQLLKFDRYVVLNEVSYMELSGDLLTYKSSINAKKYSSSKLFHIRDTEVEWEDRDARGEDIIFSEKLIKELNSIEIEANTYIVCHIPNVLDV